MVTDLDATFTIDTKKRDQLIHKDPKSVEIIKPILRGCDLKRYHYEFAELYLLHVHNGYQKSVVVPDDAAVNSKTVVIPPININDYPAVKEHLDGFQSALSQRQIQGCTLYNLPTCAELEKFSKEKLIYREIAENSCFAYNEKGEFLVSDTVCLLTGSNLILLMASLNSKLINFAYKCFYGPVCAEGVLWSRLHVQKIPIPPLDTLEKQEIAFEVGYFVSQILEFKAEDPSSDISFQEYKIDNLVCELYELTEKEKVLISSAESDKSLI